MIEIEQALAAIYQRTEPRQAERLPLSQAVGRVLAEDILSDIDSPPYDKALVDGYAVVATDMRGGRGDFMVIDEVRAGDIPCEPLQSGMATRVMAGAPVPRGADTVVPGERAQADDSGDLPLVHLEEPNVRPGQHILPRGTSLQRGQTVLSQGHRLTAIEIGILAEVGRLEVLVHPQPRLSVLAVGDQLVSPAEVPGAGQIRNSTGPMLGALIQAAGGQAVDRGIALDTEPELTRQINQGFREDALVLCGSVTTGAMEMVPRVLRDLGVERVFQGVRVSPGRTFWLGTLGHARGRRFVFGVPDNPVSALVCFYLFVRPAITALAGYPVDEPVRIQAHLADAYHQRGDRPTYHPVRLERQNEKMVVRLLDPRGMPDLKALAEASGLALFPGGRTDFAPGQTISVIRF